MTNRRRRKTPQPPFPDPTIPNISIEVDNETFRLCFDFAALALAKAKLRDGGIVMNILRSIQFEEIDVDTLPQLFFAASQRFQPDLTWEKARAIVTMRTAAGIFGGVASAYQAAMLEPTKNPPRAPEKS